jgi:hypothetical protein
MTFIRTPPNASNGVGKSDEAQCAPRPCGPHPWRGTDLQCKCALSGMQIPRLCKRCSGTPRPHSTLGPAEGPRPMPVGRADFLCRLPMPLAAAGSRRDPLPGKSFWPLKHPPCPPIRHTAPQQGIERGRLCPESGGPKTPGPKPSGSKQKGPAREGETRCSRCLKGSPLA